MRNIASVLLVHFITWDFVVLYYLLMGISTLTEFVIVFIVTGLLVNGVYLFWSITRLKRKFNVWKIKNGKVYYK